MNKILITKTMQINTQKINTNKQSSIIHNIGILTKLTIYKIKSQTL